MVCAILTPSLPSRAVGVSLQIRDSEHVESWEKARRKTEFSLATGWKSRERAQVREACSSQLAGLWGKRSDLVQAGETGP